MIAPPPRPWIAASLLCLAALLLASCASSVRAPARSAAAARPDPSDALFVSGVIPHIRIEITESNLARLRREDRRYVPCTIREGTNVWEDVGVHRKGAAGSTRDLNDQPALSVNFDKFVHDQKFFGLDKFHLNNSVQDASRLCEILCARLFAEAGVPAARVGHARVSLNGRDLGLYVLKEGFDKSFLRRHFPNPNGNLYDGGFLADIDGNPQRTSGSGDVANRADLKALVAAAQDKDPTNRFARLERLLDLDRFLSFVALEVITWHWDGYVMNRNNYRVYHDPDRDKLLFFPHGMDQMFWDPNGPLIPGNLQGLVSRALLQTPEGRRRYRARLAEITTNYFTAERMTNYIQVLQDRLQSSLQAWNPGEAKRQAGDANRIRNLVLERIKVLERRLAEPEPKPLPFDAQGVAPLVNWEPPKSDALPPAKLEVVTLDGLKALRIAALPKTNCIGSFRTRVLLDAGTYILEGRVRTAGVEPIAKEKDTPNKGAGAGLRISQPAAARPNQLLGDQPWQKLEYEFTVPAGPDEVVLICELRASAGEAWFDLGSLRLRRK
ncbi:MAG: hypothetical protein RJA22_1158 [Verrucomicrobiota bacterium]